MKISTEHKVEALGDGKTSRLTIIVLLDDKLVGTTTALSGPTEDVQEYLDGKVTLDELDQRWRFQKAAGSVRAQTIRKHPTPDTPLRVGFWWSRDESTLPKAETHVDANWDAGEREIVSRYVKARGVAKDHYKGFSNCRICGCSNGSADMTDGHYIWPEGFLHYLTEHNVKPPQAFIDHVMKMVRPPPRQPVSEPTEEVSSEEEPKE